VDAGSTSRTRRRGNGAAGSIAWTEEPKEATWGLVVAVAVAAFFAGAFFAQLIGMA
jgi:hypothetical protein